MFHVEQVQLQYVVHPVIPDLLKIISLLDARRVSIGGSLIQ